MRTTVAYAARNASRCGDDPGRKRTTGTRSPMVLNQRWSLDLVTGAHGRTPLPHAVRGRRLHPRSAGVRVGRELDRVFARRVAQSMTVSENGIKMINHAILSW